MYLINDIVIESDMWKPAVIINYSHMYNPEKLKCIIVC